MNPRHEAKLAALVASGRLTEAQQVRLGAALAAAEMRCACQSRGANRFSGYLLGAALALFALVVLLFLPYTHQLDEIKGVLVRVAAPVLLLLALRDLDFRGFLRRSNLPLVFLALLALSMLVSFLLNPAYWQVAERSLWFSAALMALALTLATTVNTPSRLHLAANAFSAVVLATAVVGLFLRFGPIEKVAGAMKTQTFFRNRPEWITLAQTLAASRDELFSTVLNTEFYAVFVIAASPIALALALVGTRRWQRAIGVTGFALANLCLALGGSWFPLIVGMLAAYPLFLWVATKRLGGLDGAASLRRTWRWVAGSAGVFLVCCLVLSRMALVPAGNMAPIEGRLMLARGGLLAWLYHDDAAMQSVSWGSLLFGNGPAGYRLFFPLFRAPDYFEHGVNSVTSTAHNLLVDYMCEYGVVGAGLLVVFLGWVVWLAIRQITRTTALDRCLFQLAAVTGLAAILTTSLVSPATQWTVGAVTLWCLLGMSMAITRLECAGAPAIPVPDRIAVLARLAAPEWRVLIPVVAHGALAVVAIAFLLRSTPQGLAYYRAAVENSAGLRFMEKAEALTGEQQTKCLLTAQGHFQRAITLNPTFSTSYYKLAHIKNRMNDRDGAIATYEELLRVEPHYSETDLNLGIMYSTKAAAATGAERQTLLEKAMVATREAARQSLKPDVQCVAGRVARQLGDEYRSTGSLDKALQAYQESRGHWLNIIAHRPANKQQMDSRARQLDNARRQFRELLDLSSSLTKDGQTASTMALPAQTK
jgi:tetratricopeptide (TPR) repeat protein